MPSDTLSLITVFISYSYDSQEHMAWVGRLADALEKEIDIHVVCDQYDVYAGSDVTEFMKRGVESDRVVMVLTPTYAAKAQAPRTGVRYENLLITGEIFKGAPSDKFIPALRGDADHSIPPYLKSKAWVDMTSDERFAEKVAEILRGIRRQGARPRLGKRSSIEAGDSSKSDLEPRRLVDRLSRSGHWPNLLKAAIQAVTAGGTAAMFHYRRSMERPERRVGDDPRLKNPSTIADIDATEAALQALSNDLARLARQSDCALKYLGEETIDAEWLEGRVDGRILDRVKAPGDFFQEGGNDLRVILDGIDGTYSFVRGIPLFCSAVAILVGTQPRISAIYDPIHNIVYSAMLTGPVEDPEAEAEASVWAISTGDRLDLIASHRQRQTTDLKQEAVGVHFSRSHPEKLTVLLSTGGHEWSMLERLSRGCGAVYALKSGVLAMTEVARGAFAGFVNVTTNLWDVAAGEVLIKACGGKVTDLEGKPIDYARFGEVSLLAAKREMHPRLLQLVQGGVE